VNERVDRLRRLDTCAVSDARDRLGLGDAVVGGISNLVDDQPIAGVVTTVRLGPVATAVPTRHLCTEAIEFSGDDHVIVIDHQQRNDCAGWGGNLSRAAQYRGVAGTVVFGAIRDVDEAREIGYPVYATAATPRTARGRTQEHTWNETITIAGVRVEPGDFVIADGTGVVFISALEIDAVLDTAEEIALAEAGIASVIGEGLLVSQAMGGTYERMTMPSDTEGTR
jgi:4-hydroxy-4-methyl-2-oxoglutarate aldolase